MTSPALFKFVKAGTTSTIKIAMMPMTTISSTSVKPEVGGRRSEVSRRRHSSATEAQRSNSGRRAFSSERGQRRAGVLTYLLITMVHCQERTSSTAVVAFLSPLPPALSFPSDQAMQPMVSEVVPAFAV